VISHVPSCGAFLAYIQHPAISPHLQNYDLGSSEREAKHALILDREQNLVFIAPVKEAERFLKEQWPSQQHIRISEEEYLARISIALKDTKQPDIEEIQRQIEMQNYLIEDMLKWLDKFLKN
jgi:hypothetical protein